jgi:hypothetical protein
VIVTYNDQRLMKKEPEGSKWVGVLLFPLLREEQVVDCCHS